VRGSAYVEEANMRTGIGWALAAVLSVAPVRADDRDAALAVVSEAIRAHGGEDALAKLQTFVRKSEGRMTVAGKEVPFAEEQTAQLPVRLHRETEIRAAAQKLRVLLVLNGDKGWQSAGGAVLDVGAERLRELREDGYAQWLNTLVPLMKDPAVRLAPLPDIKMNGETARGVKATSKGRPDVSLYFDGKSCLLIKTERQASEAGETAVREEAYSGYKEFDGVKLPTKIALTVGGKRFSDITEAVYKFPEKAPEGTFAKP
jgi:hypothetical protein